LVENISVKKYLLHEIISFEMLNDANRTKFLTVDKF